MEALIRNGYYSKLFVNIPIPNNNVKRLGIPYARACKEQIEICIGGHPFAFEQYVNHKLIGAVVWDCGITLCNVLQCLVENAKIDFSNLKILELGSGTGIVGIFLSKFGAQCTITDIDGNLELLQRNANLNKVCPNVRRLVWGEDHLETEHWDIVLGSDVLYEPKAYTSLQQTILETCGKNTVLILCIKFRKEREEQDFLDTLNRQGFQLHLLDPIENVTPSGIYIIMALRGDVSDANT